MFTSRLSLQRFSIVAFFLWLLLNSSSAITTTRAQARAYVTNHSDNTISIIDTDTNTVVANVPVGLSPSGVAITPDGAHVYVVNRGSSTVSVIDTETNTVVNTVFVSPPPVGVAITPDGTRFYVTSSNSSSTVLDTATNAVVTTIPLRFLASGVVFTPDGARAYVEQQNEFFDVIDTATNTVIIDLLQAAVFHDRLAITPDGTRLYATSPVMKQVSVIDTSTNAVVNSIPLDHPSFAAITSDGTRVYTATVLNTVSVIDTVTNTVTATIPVTTNPVFGCLLRIAITPVPTNKDDCKDGGYKKFGALGFPNQGQCVKYVNRHAN
jgi:YVTN family beta-propeller protein